MYFAQGYLLNWIWAVIPLAIFLMRSFKRRQKLLKEFAKEPLLKELVSYSPKRQMVKYLLLCFVFIFSILALSRPQWGFQWQEMKREGLDILVAIDTSKSMFTRDVKPNRLERTKLAVEDLLKKLRGDRIGLIAFAGEAFLLCPLTTDYSGFALSLHDVNTDTVPRGGTNIAQAIEESLRGFETPSGQSLVLIIVTDGENLEGDPLSLAKKAKEKGIRIFTVGIGTREGELIQFENERGEKEFLKDAQGNFIKSRLNEELLKEIALTSGGIYIRSSGAQLGMDLIYEKELSKLGKKEFEAKMTKKYHERFQIPLAFAFFLLILQSCLNTRIDKKE